MSDFLESMARSSLLRADGLKAGAGSEGLESRASSARPALPLQLNDRGFDLIAEAKLASPAEGRLAPMGEERARVTALATEMAAAQPAALSVLTEPESFDGDMAHLEAVTESVDVPVMRKDFLVEPIQVLEARAYGASGVLLIARITTSELLQEMTDLAIDLGMFVLAEIFEERELDTVSTIFDRDILIGVNARDLVTLRVNPDRHAYMAPLLPDHLPAVAESGIASPEDAAVRAELGYRLALVGTSLVTGGMPGPATRAMIEAGRSAASVVSS